MRLKAPHGRGHPSVNGREIEPSPDGTYSIDDHAVARNLIEAFGYTDADAPEPLDDIADALIEAASRRRPT
jgi:hypothetical protein